MSQTEFFIDPGTEQLRGAVISDDGRYRYRLWRTWAPELPRMAWIMLNPSTADAEVDDPTIRRCVGFAKREGCGGIEVVNLYAYRSTDPSVLGTVDEKHGDCQCSTGCGFGCSKVVRRGAPDEGEEP